MSAKLLDLPVAVTRGLARLFAAGAWCAVARHRLPAIMFCLSAAIGLMVLELTARCR
jgi:hypothetical protein